MLAAALFAVPALQALPSASPERRLWVTDEFVSTLTYSDGLLYLGGPFNWVGPPTGGFAPVDVSDGSVPKDYPRILGEVLAVEPDGLGGWFIGGDFTFVDDVECRHLVHVSSAGDLADWCANVDGPVRSLDLDGGVLYLGGDFVNVSGAERKHLAALDAATGALLPWDPGAGSGLTSSEEVLTLDVEAGTAYVGGDFEGELIGGATRSHFVALDATTGAALPLNPSPDGSVLDVHVDGDSLFLAGTFQVLGGLLRRSVAEIDLTTGAPTNLKLTPDSTVFTLATSGNVLYLGGLFDQIGLSDRQHLAAVDRSTYQLLDWSPKVDGSDGFSGGVFSLDADGGVVYAGGSFLSVDGQRRAHVVAVDGSSGAVLPWTANASGPSSTKVWSVASDGAALGVGGDMTSVGSVFRPGAAALDVLTGEATAWQPILATQLDPLLPGRANRILVDGPVIYLLGLFQFVAGALHHDAVAVDEASGAPEPGFTSQVTDSAGFVETAVRDGDGLLLAGKLAGSLVERISAATGAVDPAFQLAPNNDIRVFEPADDGRMLIGGEFVELVDAFGLHPRRGAAAIDPLSGAVGAWDPDADDDVLALAVRDDRVYLGGTFLQVGGELRRNLAAVDSDTGALLPWTADVTGSGTTVVSVLLSHLDVLLVGGGFDTIAGVGASDLAALDAETGAVLPWSVESASTPAEFAIGQGRLFVGGGFSSLGGVATWNVASFVIEYLSAEVQELSVSAGGVQELALETGSDLGGLAYALAGSASGTEPGFDAFGLHVPLNPDAYLLLSLGPGSPLANASVGALDAGGAAAIDLTLPPGSNPGYVGLELHHAAAVFSPLTGAVELITNPVQLRLVP